MRYEEKHAALRRGEVFIVAPSEVAKSTERYDTAPETILGCIIVSGSADTAAVLRTDILLANGLPVVDRDLVAHRAFLRVLEYPTEEERDAIAAWVKRIAAMGSKNRLLSAVQNTQRMTDQYLSWLTWRFAAMIGIIEPNVDYSTAEEVAADREKWPHLVVVEKCGPVFNFDLCAEWMAEISGEPLARCRKVLFAEWGDEDDQQFA